MQGLNQLAGECVEALRQGLALVERLDDQLYAGTSAEAPRGGVGGHLRHCLDFYQSFLSGLPHRRVNYNARARDPLIERDRAHASAKLQAVIAELEELPAEVADTTLLVAPEGSAYETGEESAWCRSTVGRELQFLLSHTTHHYALVALLLRLRGFDPGEEFGVNPSTLRHWRREEEAACAR
jgi:uncharacterized damage-inducible protein DinB